MNNDTAIDSVTLRAEFLAIAKAKNLTNLGRYITWKHNNPKDAEKYQDVAKSVYGKATFKLTGGGKKGRSYHYITKIEFDTLCEKQGFNTMTDYINWRKDQPESVKATLPRSPVSYYSTLQDE